MADINLGDHVKDKITGFEGIVIGITEWLYQCRRPIVQGLQLKDGKPVDLSFDEPQLVIVKRGVIAPAQPVAAAPTAKTGGPRDTPSPRQL